MNTKKSLRILIIFSFFIFYLPFLDTCSEREETTEETTEITEAVEEEEIELSTVLKKETKEIKQETFQALEVQKVQEETTITSFLNPNNDINMYIMSLLFVNVFDDYKVLFDFSLYISLCFLLIIIFNIFITIQSFRNRHKSVFIYNLINIILLIASYLALYFIDIIEHYWQIKYGAIFFLINSLGIVYLSNKLKNKSN